MKRWKYVVIGVAAVGLIVLAGAGCFGEPAKPKSDTKEVDWHEQCLANAIKADWRETASINYLLKAVYVEGEVTYFQMSPIYHDHCSFIVMADDDGFPWMVDTFASRCPGVESNCIWLFDGRKVKVWGYVWFWGPIPEDVTEPCFFEIAACVIEKSQ
ncbi:MAG: hypothetical protein E3J66_07080 [Dehalococcoidia bacterium]|nr:MAG: hypothetical protein E3J66_07080 [Dehalococcoidia bacterium]